MDSYVADSMKEAGFRQAVMGRYPSETVFLHIDHFSLFFLGKQKTDSIKSGLTTNFNWF